MAFEPLPRQPGEMAGKPGLAVEMHASLTQVAGEWRAFQARAAGEPHQTLEWVSAWLSAHPDRHSVEPAIALCRDGAGRCVAILPFAIRRRFGCATLEWLGADQGNYSSGLFDPAYWRRGDAPDAAALLDAVLSAIPGIDAVHLADHPTQLHGLPNPLAGLPGVAAPSDGYAFSIAPGWRPEGDDRFGARYMKGIRRNMRRLRKQGEVAILRVEKPAERIAALDTLFEQKSRWFAGRGIPDCFAGEGLRGFYRALVSAPDEGGLSVRLHELRVGDEVAAVSLDLLFGARYDGLIASTASGELARFGPGNILFHRLVEDLSEEGVKVFDLGAGESDQKRRWCTDRRRRRHALAPVTEKGRLYTAALSAKLIAKTQVKRTPWLLRLANAMRRHSPRLLSSLPLLAAGGSLATLLEA